MGYRRTPTIHTIDDVPGEDGLIVRLQTIRIGRLRKLMTATASAGDDELDGAVDEILDLLAEGLVSWNLEDDKGPVPANREGIDDQEMGFIMAVIECWVDRMTIVPDELGKGSPSGAKSLVPPLTMEAL